MLKAPTAAVSISAICPRTKGHVSDNVEILNSAFKDLAVRLDCHFIDAGTHMTYRNGNIDETQLVDGLHLSARGIETLAKLLADSVDGLNITTEPWHKVVRNPSKRQANSSDHMSFQRGSRDPSRGSQNFSHSNSRRQQRDNYTRRNVHNHSNNKNSYRNKNSNSRSNYTGCYNCGLKNHNQSTCRHNERVRCNKCNRLGHKANYCFSSNHDHGNVRPRF